MTVLVSFEYDVVLGCQCSILTRRLQVLRFLIETSSINCYGSSSTYQIHILLDSLLYQASILKFLLL